MIFLNDRCDYKFKGTVHMGKRLTSRYLSTITIKGIIFSTFLVAFISQGLFADDTGEARDLLQKKFDDMIKVLKNRNIDKESKKAKIEDIFKPGFDFPLMSKLSLGRESWTAMTNEDQEKFVGLFTKVFRQAYLDKILKYVDEEVIFEESRQDGKKVYVQSFIVSRDKKTSVLYKFYQSGAGWKIYDVEIEGISYIQTYRSQFTESLKEITVEELMVKMEKLISSQ